MEEIVHLDLVLRALRLIVYLILLIYRMENVLTAAVKNRSWQGANGVITEGSDNTKNNDGIGFKGKGQLLSFDRPHRVYQPPTPAAIFIRGLLMAHSRSQNRDLQILVHSYNDVQVSIGRSMHV